MECLICGKEIEGIWWAVVDKKAKKIGYCCSYDCYKKYENGERENFNNNGGKKINER